MVVGLDGYHHCWAGTGDGEFAHDLNVVGGKVLFDGVVSEEDGAANAVSVQCFDNNCAEFHRPVIPEKSFVNFPNSRQFCDSVGK